MNQFIYSVTLAVGCLMMSYSADANDYPMRLTMATGWPYLLVPTVTVEHKQVEYYAQYKLGLDDGFSLGIQRHLGHHVYGVFVGAIGTKKARNTCGETYACDAFIVSINDHKSTQGLGFSYEYRFNSNSSGWALRTELGYGTESRDDNKRADGNVQILYHF